MRHACHDVVVLYSSLVRIMLIVSIILSLSLSLSHTHTHLYVCIHVTTHSSHQSSTRSETLNLAGNGLSGTFPDMSYLDKLERLYLHNNHIGGPIHQSTLRMNRLSEFPILLSS